MRTQIDTIHSLALYVLMTVSFLLGLGGIFKPYAATAATYYVAASGNDANLGTTTSPFRTIQKAADLVNPGDTVIVDDGAYTDTVGKGVVVYVKRGGTSGAWVTFKSKNKWGAKVDGQNVAQYGWYFAAGYVIVQDFDVTGEASSNGPTGFCSVSGKNNIQIIGNHIHDIGRECSDSTQGKTGIYGNLQAVTIERNVIHDIGRFSPGENGCNPSTPYYQNHDHGIYMEGSADVSIKNNIFFNNKHGWSIHIYPKAVSNVRILNNTFLYPNTYQPGHIILAAPISDSVIANNIFYQPSTVAIEVYTNRPMSNVLVENNITYNGTIIKGGGPAGMTLSGNLNNTDPRLVNPAALDLHLQYLSPAVDAGVTSPEVPTDFDGTSRPQGGSNDIGAYEFNQQNASAPSAPNNLQVKTQ